MSDIRVSVDQSNNLTATVGQVSGVQVISSESGPTGATGLTGATGADSTVPGATGLQGSTGLTGATVPIQMFLVQLDQRVLKVLLV